MHSGTFRNGVFPTPILKIKLARPLSDTSMRLIFVHSCIRLNPYIQCDYFFRSMLLNLKVT